jgi:hypothetical protein
LPAQASFRPPEFQTDPLPKTRIRDRISDIYRVEVLNVKSAAEDAIALPYAAECAGFG